jgi:ribosomal protein S18 acetylase RimI-like enzyme
MAVQRRIKLVENIPLDTKAIADLITAQNDLHLVWPIAKYPFDHSQWEEVLDPEEGNKSFLVYDGDKRIGHAALRTTDSPRVYAVSFLYLIPELRRQGLGRAMLESLEQYARESLSAKKLILVVRTYNPSAVKCYTACGFEENSRDGTLIRMSKVLTHPAELGKK